MLPRSVDRVVLLAFLVAVIVLGANWVGVRFSNRELPPFWGAGLRFAAASAVLFAWLVLRHIQLPRGRALIGALVYGTFHYGVNFGLLYWALVSVPAGMTSVVFAVLPLMTLFLSAAAGFERIRTRNILGALVAVAGLAVIFSDQLTGEVPVVGVLAILAAAFFAGFISVVVKAFPRTHPVATNAIGTAVGVPILLLASLVAGERWALPELAATWIAVSYLVMSTAVGFVLLVFVIIRWTPSAASYASVLSPIITLVLATALAGEIFGPGFFVGAVIVGAGVYLGAIAAPPRAAPAPAATPAD